MKRKVFISYYHGDQEAVNKFVKEFSDVFIAKTVGVREGDFEFDSNNPNYIMRRIREKKLGDSTVTIVLIGKCTHSRRYVDWELKASLQQGSSLPNGVIGINLPYVSNKNFVPERLNDNLITGYASYHTYPQSHVQLARWIEEAHQSRYTKGHLITNGRPMMKYNSVCKYHNCNHH